MQHIELETIGISKCFGNLVANDHIDLRVNRGEVHAVMGENGAGKSTLMSILYGMQMPDQGSILLRGKEVRFRSALDAIRHGVGMVHQSFKLFDAMPVWENVVYGAEPTSLGLLDRRTAMDHVAALGERFRLRVDPTVKVGRLSLGMRQRVEILKALHRNARLLILDEPTAVLTPYERDGLFEVLRNLTADDRTVLFVTHKLHEVMAITDRITVLRSGKVAERLETKETTPQQIIHAMTGRFVELTASKKSAEPGAIVLSVSDLSVGMALSIPTVDRLSFQVRAGEIVGVAGVAGNGQSELVEALTGLTSPEGGRVSIGQTRVTFDTVEAHRRAGLAYVPEDRALTGSAKNASATDNLLMGSQRKPGFSRSSLLNRTAAADFARSIISRFGIKIDNENVPVSRLSGGNLQKVVIGRELGHQAPLLIVEQPTRGVDVGAIEFIHREIIRERDRGCAILLVSAELNEILALSDRILVMFEGRILADLCASEATEEKLGLLMAGGVTEST